MATAPISDAEDLVLSIIHEHGPTHFTSGADLGACESLTARGYIEEYAGGPHKALTPRGLSYLKKH